MRGKRLGDAMPIVTLQDFVKALQAVLCRGRVRGPAHESDPLIAARDQRARGHPPAFDVVDSDHIHRGLAAMRPKECTTGTPASWNAMANSGGSVEEATITPSTEYWRSHRNESSGSV